MRETALRWFRLVFGGTFSLNFIGFENTVWSEAAIGQRLGIVFERIGKRIGSCIDNIQSLTALVQDEGDLRSLFHDRSGLYVATHSKPLPVRSGPHLLQLRDGFVVGFCIADPAHCEPDQRSHNQDHQTPELYVRIHISGDWI